MHDPRGELWAIRRQGLIRRLICKQPSSPKDKSSFPSSWSDPIEMLEGHIFSAQCFLVFQAEGIIMVARCLVFSSLVLFLALDTNMQPTKGQIIEKEGAVVKKMSDNHLECPTSRSSKRQSSKTS
jgi:hypothetical protein